MGNENMGEGNKKVSDASVDSSAFKKMHKNKKSATSDKVSNVIPTGPSSLLGTHTDTHCRSCNPNIEKYDLELKFKPKYREVIDKAKDYPIFKLWDSQMSDKYGFIPLGDQMIPNTKLKCHSTKIILDIHREITKSDTFIQIQIDSQLKPEVRESFLSGYWDVQLSYLIRYGFPIDFDNNSALKCDTTDHTSAVAFPENVNEYLDEEIKFKAILGPFKEPPINDLHISPLMTL